MAQKLVTYSKAQYIDEIKKRLSILHVVDDTYVVSKNVVKFKVDGVELYLHKDKDPDTGILRTIIESCHTYEEDEDMFPCSFVNAQAKNFIESEVVAAVNAIDRHFMEKIGYDPDHFAICSMYNSMKYGLLPCVATDYSDEEYVAKIQSEILSLLSYEAINQSQYTEKGVTLCFLGKNVETDKEDKCFIFLCTDTEVTLFIVDYTDSISITSVDDENIKSYTFKYGDYQGMGLTNAIKKVLKTHYAFALQSIVFAPVEENEESEEEKE